jgi:hypothetical protein
MSRLTCDRLPAVECTPWCRDGDGHTDELHPEDQWCHADVQIVRLSRMPMHNFKLPVLGATPASVRLARHRGAGVL